MDDEEWDFTIRAVLVAVAVIAWFFWG